MKQTRKDIFGNTYSVEIGSSNNRAKTFEQKLREAKAKQKYKKFQKEQRSQQIANLKMTAERSRQSLQKITAKAKAGYKRATDKRLGTVKNKMRGSIYEK